MGRYGDTAIATTIYAVNISLEAIAFAALWWYCAQREMLGEPLTPEQTRLELLVRAMVPAVFLISIPIAFFVSPAIAAFSWPLSIPAQGLLERRFVSRGEVPPGDGLD
jgi:hypothetical protein